LAKLEGVSDDDRFETLKSEDKITVSILPHNYTMKFLASEPFGIGGVQYFVQPDEIRAGVGSKEEYETLIESKKERVQELFVRNNEWMKNLSRDDVDERKAAFRKDLDEPRNADDVEMTDA
jgi:paired amphipathic helix protein Sin3a